MSTTSNQADQEAAEFSAACERVQAKLLPHLENECLLVLVSVLGRLITLAASSATSYENSCDLVDTAKKSIELFEQELHKAYAKAGTEMQNQSVH